MNDNTLTQKKLGRPFSKKICPTITLTEPQLFLIFSSLKEHGCISVNGIGTLEIRKIKSRKTFHNRANKIITIKAREKLHLVNDSKALAGSLFN